MSPHPPLKLVKLTRLPEDKDLQVDATVRAMIEVTLVEAWNADVRWLLNHIRLPHYTELETAEAATRFIRARLPFEFDPEDIELVRTPSYYARAIRARQFPGGDCDDFALLLGTLLQSMGTQRIAYVVMARSPVVREFGHVFVAALIRSKWECLDPSVSRPYSTDGLRRKWYYVPWGKGPPAL